MVNPSILIEGIDKLMQDVMEEKEEIKEAFMTCLTFLNDLNG